MAHKYLLLCTHWFYMVFFLQNYWINSVRRHGVFRNPIISIAIPESCGILEGISDQSRGNCLGLPPNWYENKDLLGFAIFCAFVESRVVGCRCYLTIKGNGKHENLGYFSLLSKPWLDYDISDLACITCYTKADIEGKYHSNQWTHLVASFDSDARVEGCSIHLIYAKDYVQMHPSMVQASSSCGNSFINGTRQFFSRGNSSINGTRKFFSCGNSRDHGSPTEDDYINADNKRSPIELSHVDESHHK